MSTVPLWSGREVRALREARRMSVREFAAHLGVSDRMVSKWEAGGDAIRPRPLNQAALDTSLGLASPEERNRFNHIALGPPPMVQQRQPAEPVATPRATPLPVPLAVGGHLARHPLDGKLMSLVDGGPFRAGKGRRSIWLTAFYVDVYPVTNAEYGRFRAALGDPRAARWSGVLPENLESGSDPSDHDPATDVEWDDVLHYARWASKTVPTADQWDRASRGGEAVTLPHLWEWCDSNVGPARRGPKGADSGGFRCVSSSSEMLTLLAI